MREKSVDRRRFLYATGVAATVALAGCSSSGGSDDASSSDGGEETTASGTDGSEGSDGDRSFLDEEPNYDGWLDGATNYDGTVDLTGQDQVTVGYESLSFDPAAIAISSGTEVVWEWTGEGGSHNVVSQDDGPLESETTDVAGHTYSHTFEESGPFTYSCTPHEATGMKGAVYVE